MTALQRLGLLLAVGLLSACNMVLSEKPMFAEADRASFAPRDGLWLAKDPECAFDPVLPEARWPACAMWVIARNAGTTMILRDGKGQSEKSDGLLAGGDPAILEFRWVDTANNSRPYFAYLALEPRTIASDNRFAVTLMWNVECGVQQKGGTAIEPFPGISPECRPASQESIRSAARLSRRPEEVREWRWLRAEANAD